MDQLAYLLTHSALVVKGIQIDETADLQVKIVARKSGPILWVLLILGIDPTYTLRIYRDRIESEEMSSEGWEKKSFPFQSLESYSYKLTRPFLYLIFSAAFAFAGIDVFVRFPENSIIAFFLFLIALIFTIIYFLKVGITFRIKANEGNAIVLIFRRSVIEGITIAEQLAVSKQISEIVRQNYIANTSGEE